MGKATEYLTKLIEKQVQERGIVVWFDPENIYASLAAELNLQDTRVVQFDGSYFALRRQVDVLMNDTRNDQPPKLVLYVRADRAATKHALDEFIYAGIVMQPEGESAALTTKLESVARNALKLPSETLEKVCAQIRGGAIKSLAELDTVAEQVSPDLVGSLTLIFKTGGANEIALKFLTDPSFDKELEAKSAVPSLAAFLNQSYDAGLPEQETPTGLRARFRRHLLVTEFRMALRGEPPESLETVRLPASSQVRSECVELVHTWRNRRDLQSSYTDAAQRVQHEMGLGQLPCDWQALREVETFPTVDDRLQDCIADALVDQPTAELIEVAEKRQSALWADVDPDLRIRWTLIATAGRLLRKVEEVQAALRVSPPQNAVDYIERYTEGEQPWCQVDTEHRMLERLAANIDFDAHGAHASLERLLARARQEYSKWVDSLARKFVRAYAEAKFDLGGLTKQIEIFARYVAISHVPKTAYVLVDALRYEMARDLSAGLAKEWQCELVPALATPPTITPVGMGALLPGAERGITLVDAGGGRLAVEFEGKQFKERKERVKWLEGKINGLFEVKLDSLTPASKSTRESIKRAPFILVTSQEIDWLGEGESTNQAREFMDSALDKLGRAFRILAELGVERIVVTADHGYIFAEELDTDSTLEAPGGQTADLHRRVWVGKGGQAYDQVLRVSARALGLGSDLELATPYGLACFTSGGSKAYLHGGLSLQELVIPVVVIQPTVIPSQVSAEIEWELVPGSAKLTTRFFSATVKGIGKGMFELRLPRVRVEVRSRNKPVSVPVTATYGYQEATGEVELKAKKDAPREIEPNSVAVMITSEIEQKTASVLLLNAETGETLKKLEVDVAISI